VSGALYASIRDLVPAARLEARGDVAMRSKSEPIAVSTKRL
jgi:hypothetical protein